MGRRRAAWETPFGSTLRNRGWSFVVIIKHKMQAKCKNFNFVDRGADLGVAIRAGMLFPAAPGHGLWAGGEHGQAGGVWARGGLRPVAPEPCEAVDLSGGSGRVEVRATFGPSSFSPARIWRSKI